MLGPTYAVGAFPVSLAAADLDDDSSLEIVVANRDTDTVSIIDAQLIGLITHSVGRLPVEVLVTDLDGDPYPEILTVNSGDGTVSVIRRDSPVLRSTSRLPLGEPSSITAVDIEPDGDNDLVVATRDASGCAAIRVLRNDFTIGDETLILAEIDPVQVPRDLVAVRSADMDSASAQDVIFLARTAAGAGTCPSADTVGVLLNMDRCPADFSGPLGVPDGRVDALDFLLLLNQWGSPCVGTCEADVTGPIPLTPDGNVDAFDFLLLVSQWGAPASCP
jgi:hypothetical protein